jgi:hypothetical protein
LRHSELGRSLGETALARNGGERYKIIQMVSCHS